MLCQMNLILHGLDFPNIDSGNSLRFPLRDIGDKDRVSIILTNPPFGGEEEKGILNNFPDDKRTAETALLFLQLIMRKLKRSKPGIEGGRAAVIVPHGTLFADGIAARVKKQLVDEFNLHTIVRLGEEFSPPTQIFQATFYFSHKEALRRRFGTMSCSHQMRGRSTVKLAQFSMRNLLNLKSGGQKEKKVTQHGK